MKTSNRAPVSGAHRRRGNCYVASEALYHLLGGKAAGWTAVRVRTPGDTHWWLEHRSGLRLDPTAAQFGRGAQPNYAKGVRTGFLTRQPSRRARALMDRIVWQEVPR